MTKERFDVAVYLRQSMVPLNPRVRSIARRLGWQPETLVRRVKEALPAPVEQQLYLQLGDSFGLQPESLAKILRELLTRELAPSDLVDQRVGTGLISNPFRNAVDLVSEAFNLLGRVSEDYQGVSISMHSAARIVMTYGAQAEEVIASIHANLGEIAEILDMERRADTRIVSVAVHILAQEILPELQRAGCPAPLDVLEAFRERRIEVGKCLRDMED